MSASAAPSGDVTLLFTDIEGSTRGWDRFRELFREALERHNALIRQMLARWQGYEVKTAGDGFMAAFADPIAAACCALDIQRVIEAEPFEAVGGLRVRIGIHCGQMEPRNGDYQGPIVNRASRIENAGQGGMILLSEEAALRIVKSLPTGAQLIDLGFHRLRDLGTAQRLFQLTHPDLPDRDYSLLRTLDSLLHNFPAQVTSFVGRDTEIAEIRDLFFVLPTRLITLTGPGGIGKTRLAMQAAVDNLQRFPDGVWLVELAHLTHAREVPTALALALRVPLSNDTDDDITSQVFAYLRERKSLLVLDNFEQVVEAARFLSDLLRACPHLVCLVTSRQLLQVSGEQEFPVAPLGLPPGDVSAENCLNFESIRLFVERAQTVRPDFEMTADTTPAVARICRRLEGIPLAVELTATLVRGMTPQQILPRLRDRFRLLETSRRDLEPRQRSLRGALDWSYDLLSESERLLFAQLAVFAGGFFLEDVEAVCTEADAFGLVMSLRDKSLLKTDEVLGETRYAMLETLREYAQEKLEREDGLRELQQAHARYFQRKGTQLAEQLTRGDAVSALQRLTLDLDNLRAGMKWAEAQQNHDLTIGYSMVLARYFLRRGPYSEAERWLETAETVERARLAQNKTEGSPDEQESRLAPILLQRGLFHYKRAEYDSAAPFFMECLELFRQAEDWDRVVSTLANLGNIAWGISQREQAEARWQEALAIVRAQRLPRHEGDLLTNLAILAYQQGDVEQAQDYFEQAISLLNRSGDQEGRAYACMNYVELLMTHYETLLDSERDEQGDSLLERAAHHAEESHRLFLAMGHSEGIAQTTERMGLLALLKDDPVQAESLCRLALQLSQENGDRRCQLCALRDLGRITLYRAAHSTAPSNGAPSEAHFAAARHLRAAFAIAEELHNAAEIAGTLQCAGELAEQCGNLATAYLEYALSAREYARLEMDCSPALLRARARVGEALPRTLRVEIEERVPVTAPRDAIEEAFRLSLSVPA